eukprot:6185500-Pleurochrysis_carterae.AAC.1
MKSSEAHARAERSWRGLAYEPPPWHEGAMQEQAREQGRRTSESVEELVLSKHARPARGSGDTCAVSGAACDAEHRTCPHACAHGGGEHANALLVLIGRPSLRLIPAR